MFTLSLITSSAGIAVGVIALLNSYVLALVFSRSTTLRKQVCFVAPASNSSEEDILAHSASAVHLVTV